MKNSYSYLCLFIALVGTLFINQSCEKPFDGVNAILTNIKIDHSVNIQITDANPAATNPYPANPIVTIGGDAVDRGLIYSMSGQPLTTTAGSAKVINNTVNLAVRPFTIISKSNPLRFYIKAEATNYLQNTKEIVITSVDSLQYVKLSLLKFSSLPQGVAIKSTQTTAVNGKIPQDFVVNVTSTVAGTSTTETVVSATFPASTVYKDAANATITTAGNLNIAVVYFSAETPEAINALPGGLTATTTATTDLSTFILASAVDISGTIGRTAIKSFSTPIPFDIKVATGVFNPATQTTIKAGDQLPVWSKDANSVVWKYEGLATVTIDVATGNFKTTIQVSHPSTWMIAYNNPNCATTTNLKYVSNSNTAITALVKINLKGGNNQLIATKTISVANGELIELQLPKDLNLTVTVYDASSTSRIPFSTIDLAACATSGTITNTVVSTNPILYFDLETSCMNGKFRYSGPIDYKVSGTTLWLPFTPSEVGKLSKNLLAWDKTYDFRIIYRDVEYKRSRAVLQSEFRQTGDIWEYFGKTAVKQTFFSSPTSCK